MTRTAFTVANPRATTLRAINYSPLVEQFRTHSALNAFRLGDLVTAIGKNYGSVFTRVDCSRANGVELVSQVDLFAAESACRVIRRDSMPRPENHLVHRGQVLIAAAGQVGESTLFGRCMMADGRLAGKYLGPHVIALTFRDADVDARYAYAFLTSRPGVSLIRSTAYGTSVPSLRPDLLLDLPIPMPNKSKRIQVAGFVTEAMMQRERFVESLQAARRPVEDLAEMKEAMYACSERRARTGLFPPPFSTFSAWNYVSTGNALPLLARTWSKRLGDVVPTDGIFLGPRFARVACEPPFGIEMLTQRDVFLMRSVPQRVRHPGGHDRSLFSPAGSLLIGGAGTLGEGEIFGRAVYVSDTMSRFAVTGDMLRIQPRPGYAELAYAFLSTLVGRRLMRSTAAGTKIMRMRGDLLRRLPFPEVDAETMADVARHVHAAMHARDAAERAEAEAVRLIEAEVIPSWLS